MAPSNSRKRPNETYGEEYDRSKRATRDSSPSTVAFSGSSSIASDDDDALDVVDLSKDEDYARRLEAEFLAEERARLEQEELDAGLAASLAEQSGPDPDVSAGSSQQSFRQYGSQPPQIPQNRQSFSQSTIDLTHPRAAPPPGFYANSASSSSRPAPGPYNNGGLSSSRPVPGHYISGDPSSSRAPTQTIDLTQQPSMSQALANKIAQFSGQVSHAASAGYQHLTGLARDAGLTVGLPNMSHSYYGPEGPMYHQYESYSATQRDEIDAIVHDQAKTREEIISLLQNIQPDTMGDEEALEQTPEGIKRELYKHQRIGLTWLKKMEEGSNKGGILADDMGLGKTLQMISLIVLNKSEDERQKTTLIVAPVALLRQWERECEKMVRTNSRLRVKIYHGPNRKISVAQLRQFDILITTYGTLGTEYARIAKWEKSLKEWEGKLPEARSKVPPLRPESSLFAEKLVFHRVVLDEAQCIKNPKTQAARAACQLRAKSRFCLTGTPMMNSVNELQSLLAFLRIRPYNSAVRFREDIATPLQKSSEVEKQEAMTKLQALLSATLLRRLKSSKIDGRPIVVLPPKTLLVDHAVFNEDEKIFYDGLEQKTIIQYNKYLKAGTLGKHYSHVLVLLLRLRQTCCHPHLVKNIELEAVEGIPEGEQLEIAQTLAKSFAPDVIARIKGAEGFECPVCYEPVENPALFLPCGHDVCKECSIRIIEQANREGLANGQEANGRARCPSCRGDVSENRIVDYAVFKLVHMPEAETGDSGTKEPEPADEEDESETDDGSETDIDSETDVDKAESDSETESDLDEEKHVKRVKRADSMEITIDDVMSVKTRVEEKAKREKDKKAKAKGKSVAKTKTLDGLRQKARQNARNKRKYLEKLHETYISSTKIDKCIEILEEIEARDPTEKTIVFSQWTSLLDLLEIAVNNKQWRYQRYDGSMSARERNEAIESFQDKDNCRLLLVSLMAGNAGLNLTVASQVILLDPFWNPYLEDQAIDRAYRIGQTRPVVVHRLFIKDSVEDRIIALQQKKRDLIESALDEGAGLKLSRLGVRELGFLFGVHGRNAENPANARNMAILPRDR